MSASDYDNDGYVDLLVDNCWWEHGYHLPPHLWHNNGNRTFSRVVDSPISAHLRAAGGSAWGDYNNDGRLDLYIPDASYGAFSGCNQNGLSRNDGGTFTEITDGAIPNEGGLSSAAGWGDYDNDGFLDLFVANVGPDVNGMTRAGKAFLYHNKSDETFNKITSGSLVNDLGKGSSVSWADYNGDGFLDLFVTAGDDGNFLYRNNGPASGNNNAWIVVNLRGTKCNSFAVGAKVRLWAHYRGQDRQQLREIFTANGFGSGPPLYAHFGLGDATRGDPASDRMAIRPGPGVAERHTETVPDHLGTARAQSGDPGRRCLLVDRHCRTESPWRIESSADLKTWEELVKVNNTTRTFGYTRTAPGPWTCCFYRVVAASGEGETEVGSP